MSLFLSAFANYQQSICDIDFFLKIAFRSTLYEEHYFEIEGEGKEKPNE